MKYQTTIEVITEAKTKREAMELVDDYLAGNLISGVDMRCKTRPVYVHGAKAVMVAAASIFAVVGILACVNFDAKAKTVSYCPSYNAVQPPLKTSGKGLNSSDFKKEWEKEHQREALERIKNMQ